MTKKKTLFLLIFLLFATCMHLHAQSSDKKKIIPDTLKALYKKELLGHELPYIQKGWKFIPFPVAGYSTDYGFMFGIYTCFWNFGDGAIYPDYYHTFDLLARYNTNVSGVFRSFFDSKYLIPNFRTNFEISYMLDKAFSFYGVNGYESPYDKNQPNSFYAYERGRFYFAGNIFGPIYEKLHWGAGLSYSFSDISRGSTPSDQNTLYDHYISEGILNSSEKGGGHSFNIKFGVSYDSRDFEPAPKKGITGEITFIGSPDFSNFTDGYSHLQLFISHRQFIPLLTDRIVLAYRIAYQGVIAGEAPFYILQDLQTFSPIKTYNEGLGSEATIRGILPRRAIGAGIAWMNIEPRVHIADFKAFKQEFSIHLNPFFDMGMVVQPFRESRMREASDIIYSGESDHLHCTFGIGGKLHVNKSFIANAEIGFPINKQDGPFAFYLGTNYLF